MTKENCAFISFLCGIVAFQSFFTMSLSSPGWFLFIPILSAPGALAFGILGLKSRRRWLAMIGIVLSVPPLALLIIPLVLLLVKTGFNIVP